MSIIFLLFGFILVFALLVAGKKFAQADVRVLAARIRKYGGVAALIGAGILFVTGRIAPAIFLATFALALMGRGFNFPFGRPGMGQRSQGQTSSVKTSHLEMALDHDSRQIEGRVLRGAFAGRLLSELSEVDLAALLDELRAEDGQGAQLLEAYVERMAAGWSAGSMGSTGGGERRADASTASMTVDEAFRILNLAPGATREDIQAAHRDLMKRFHPDQGGSTYLASKINEAKAVLLRHVTQ
jgi:hypothetical protein